MTKPKTETVAVTPAADTIAAGVGDDTIAAADHGLDPNDPAVTGIPRDERHDSIDRHTGTLTEEAVQLRAEQAAAAAEQVSER